MLGERIVSFLPAGTEMACALGLGDRLVGVSHECDFPAEVTTKPVVVRPAIDMSRLTVGEIDAAVTEQLQSGASLYQVDERLLRELDPDLILTQNLCQVCAPSGNEMTQALRTLRTTPEVLYLSPQSLAEIDENVRAVGAATGSSATAERLIATGHARLERVVAVARALPTRRVFFMEWVEPVFCSGHWVPEMVALAGGHDALARPRADSVRIAWDDVLAWAPEVFIVSPCGFNLEQALGQMPRLVELPGWPDLPAVRAERVYAVDANSYFARPGPRVWEGTELLAHLIHPESFQWTGRTDAFAKLPGRDRGVVHATSV